MQSTILIVSKTKMQNGVCVGGINEQTCELVRLHNERGGNLPFDAPYEIGDRWLLDIETAWNVRDEPHIEDKQTIPISKINNVGMGGIIGFIKNHDFEERLTSGSIQNAFEGALNFVGTRNYINRNDIPSFSTQFWITDKDLIHFKIFDNHYYFYDGIRIKFVGYQDAINIIPAGTIIRLSLANWWDGDGSGEERCYLQLSGWYLE